MATLTNAQALAYIASYRDLSDALGADADAGRRHFEQFGQAEGRQISFAPLRYIASYADLIRGIGDNAEAGARHFILSGRAEGRVTSFDAPRYIASHDDLVRAFGSDADAGVSHYIRFGFAEGRPVDFDVLRYIASYPDLIRAFGTDTAAATQHYLKNGFAEGRRPTFDPIAYLLTEPDLAAAGLTPAQAIQHYVRFGFAEGRVGDAAYGREQTSFVVAKGFTDGKLETTGDRDYYSVQLAAGQHFEAVVGSLTFGLRPLVTVAQAGGTAVSEFVPKLDSTFAFTAPTSGIYHISVRAGPDSSPATGDYRLYTASLTTVPGTPGPDNLVGTAAGEIFQGGAGDDTITDTQGGSNYLYGGDGADTLFTTRSRGTAGFTMFLDGGSGDDTLRVRASDGNAIRVLSDFATVIGGTGDDVIDLAVAGADVDAGAGNDRITYDPFGARMTLTLGAGFDLVTLGARTVTSPTEISGDIRITDFVVEDDRVDLSRLIDSYADRSADPFEDGYLRLVQAGPDTLLQIDDNQQLFVFREGFPTYITFANVDAAMLTAAQLGFDPGSPGRIIDGTAAGDTLSGTSGSDTLRGLAGNDVLSGGARHDILEGGLGDDRLNGGLGNDRLYGNSYGEQGPEDGADILVDTEGGNDILFGQGGADSLSVTRTGGMTASRLYLDGGGGSDSITFSSDRATDRVTVNGGDGDDTIVVGNAAFISINASDGADQVTVSMRAAERTVTLGAGRDVLTFGRLVNEAPAATTLTVTDFKVGDDRVEMTDFLRDVLTGWDGQSNPFATGFLRLTQSSSTALLEIDRNGSANSFQALTLFQNATAANFTAAELGYDPFAPAAMSVSPTEPWLMDAGGFNI